MTEGVHQDARRNTDAAIESGQGATDLARVLDQAAGRPEFSDEPWRDDRSN